MTCPVATIRTHQYTHYLRMLALALQTFSVHKINRDELSIMSLPSNHSQTDQQIDQLNNFHHGDLNDGEAATATRGQYRA